MKVGTEFYFGLKKEAPNIIYPIFNTFYLILPKVEIVIGSMCKIQPIGSNSSISVKIILGRAQNLGIRITWKA